MGESFQLTGLKHFLDDVKTAVSFFELFTHQVCSRLLLPLV